MAEKDAIIAAIKRTARANGGKPLGKIRFERETRIRESDWYGKHWRTWNDALADAGFAPNPFGPEAHSEALLLSSYAKLTRELGHPPTGADLKMKRRADTTFPSPKTFDRLGVKHEILARVRQFCASADGFADVVSIIDGGAKTIRRSTTLAADRVGFVYLIQSGRHYKIGRTDERDQRERAYNTHNPDPRWLHVIATDDPEGVENYWHRRFAAKKLGRTDFSYRLDASDVAAFRRWKKIV